MKPVNKGRSILGLNVHGEAKPDLLERLGEFCSYCECPGAAQQLHVEHIYAQAKTAHPNLSKAWRNFLIACGTCNTYKSKHLGNDRQRKLLKKFLWPHLDNTFRAFKYFPDGRVEIPAGLKPEIRTLAESTREMVGLLKSPAVTTDYAGTSIAFDGLQKRKKAWGIAQRARTAYLENQTPGQLESLLDNANQTGYFSIWMEIFQDLPPVRRELIRTFKADSFCFDQNTQPSTKGRL